MNVLLKRWFKKRHWQPFPFQIESIEAYARGESGLIHAPTGVGKTLAAWLPILSAWLDCNPNPKIWPKRNEPLRVLWITPLRALAGDTVRSLKAVTDSLALPWSVECRTGDTSSALKAKQRLRFPSTLVTTPESLSLLLSYSETHASFASLESVVVDEWHELLSSKRGVQTELALARLRQWLPSLRVWGLSATLGNLDQAMDALLGYPEQGRGPDPANHNVTQAAGTNPRGRLITGALPKEISIETILPATLEKFPWSGHIGLRLLNDVIHALEQARTSLVFTNVRSQTEIWFRAILEARPDWQGTIGIHHGSLDRQTRQIAEEGLRTGSMRAVVCTSSLDLGVDFTPVEQVLQIGGPKGIARLVQRAGRSGHQPGSRSRVLCSPTHALELVEYSAAREALARRAIEPRVPLDAPLDVLSQHMVTVALGGGFSRDQLFHEVRTSRAYRTLSREAFDWTLEFVMKGGRSLRAYPEYCRVVETDGLCVVQSREIARFHRLSIGTITSESSVHIQFLRGKRLGSVEESFIARLKPGSCFVFAGRLLKLVRVHQMTAFVRAVRKGSATVPVWDGGRLPLSSMLADAVRRQLELARNHLESAAHSTGEESDTPCSLLKRDASDFQLSAEMQKVLPLLEIQASWSHIPRPDELLIESTTTREGKHWFLFPFGGRLTHEGLGALLAHRLSKRQPVTITVSVNDYGLELLPAQKLDLHEADWREFLSPDNLLEDMLACLNTAELARRQFREIARVAGLVFQGFPGAGKSARQVQASSSLFFDVFSKYEPDHLLLDQARREVLQHQLEISRLSGLLAQARMSTLVIKNTPKLTPLSFPLWAEMIRGQVSSESWADRVRRMSSELELEASHSVSVPA